MKTDQIRQQTTDRLIALMESGTNRPWRRPWDLGPNSGVPSSMQTRKTYRGSNAVTLDVTGMINGYTSKHWATFNAWKSVGIYPRQGQKGTWGFYYGKGIKEEDDGSKHSYSMVRTFVVFNAEQCHGTRLPEFLVAPEGTAAYEANYDTFDAMLAKHGIKVEIKGDQPAYFPGNDHIVMPKRGYFKSVGEYYATLAHEVCHWAERRAHKDHAKKDREEYAFWELSAEIGSAYLLRELGLPAVETERTENNSAIYLAGWLKALRNDNSYIFKAAGRAGQIVDYLIGRKEAKTEELVSA